jgi:hypothetical protein
MLIDLGLTSQIFRDTDLDLHSAFFDIHISMISLILSTTFPKALPDFRPSSIVPTHTFA